MNKNETKSMVVTGTVYRWVMPNRVRDEVSRQFEEVLHERAFGVLQWKFGEIEEFTKVYVFNPQKSEGEQRHIVDSHAQALKRDILAGVFTPTAVSCNLYKVHKSALVEKDGNFSLEVSAKAPLPMTDGGHRVEAVRRVRNEFTAKRDEALAKVKLALGKENREVAEQQQGVADFYENAIAMVAELPFVVMLYLDGESKVDFLNFQRGKTMDKNHGFAIQAKAGLLDDEDAQRALAVAGKLNTDKASPWYNIIRFDSQKKKNCDLPVKSLCSTSSSDISTSLVGLARVCHPLGYESYESMKELVVDTYTAILKEAPELLEKAPLLSFKDGGTVGGATLLLGMATMFGYRMAITGKDPADEDYVHLAMSARAVFGAASSEVSGPDKRRLMGEFARVYFEDHDCDKHEGVPLGLLGDGMLTPSSLNVSKPS